VKQKCILQTAEAAGAKTVTCTGFENPKANIATTAVTISTHATGDQVLEDKTNVGISDLVVPTITSSSLTLSNPVEDEVTKATFTFTIPSASGNLKAADKMEIVAALSETTSVPVTATSSLNCHSTTLGLTGCSYTHGTKLIACDIASTVMGDFGTTLNADLTPGTKTVVCEGIKNLAAPCTTTTCDAVTAGNTITFHRGTKATDTITELATNAFTREKLYLGQATTPTLSFASNTPGLTTATIGFDPAVAVASGDKWIFQFPAGTTFKSTSTSNPYAVAVETPTAAPADGKCSTAAGQVPFSACSFDTTTAKLTCTTSAADGAHAAQTLTCKNAVYAPVVGLTTQLELVIQKTGTTDTQEIGTMTMTKASGTYTAGDHTRDRAVCVAGGANILTTDVTSTPKGPMPRGVVPKFSTASFTILDGRSPVCLSQSGTEIKTPTLAKNHAGHRFIEWDGKICAAGGGSFEYFEAAATASIATKVQKDIECWDKNPNHGWVLQSMPGGTDKGGNVFEGSAPVVWRGMMCLTGGATQDVTRSASGDVTYGEFTNLAAEKFTDTVTCTADGTTWKLRAETMQVKRAFHSAASYGAKMCVSGGYNYGTSVSTVTMLDSVECSTDGKTWSYLAALSQARAYHTMFVFQGELCTVGGSRTHKYSMASFPLECSSDGRNWKLYRPNDENNGIMHSGVSIDPDGTFFVPKLSDIGTWESLRSYSRYNGWTDIALGGTVLGANDEKKRYHMPATFSFTQTGNFLSADTDDYTTEKPAGPP
jgi:hypothetical protein